MHVKVASGPGDCCRKRKLKENQYLKHIMPDPSNPETSHLMNEIRL